MARSANVHTMEPVTHALTSIALGRAGLNKITRAATPMLLVSGLIADVDWVTRLGGASHVLARPSHGHAFARWHRGDHRCGCGGLLARRTQISEVRGRIFPGAGDLRDWRGSAFAARHVERLRREAALAFQSEMVRVGSGGLGGLVDSFLLACRTCSSRNYFAWCSKKLDRSRSATAASEERSSVWYSSLLVIAGRAFAHQRAIALLDSRDYRGQTPLVVAAFPRPSNPLLWSGVVETDNALFNLEVPLGPGREFDPELADVHFKPESSVTLKNAVASPTAIEFLSFARFPLASVQPEGHGFQVRLRDMRFASELRRPARHHRRH